MRITDIKTPQAEEIARMSWGKTFIWNKCSLVEFLIAPLDKGNLNKAKLERPLAYTNNLL